MAKVKIGSRLGYGNTLLLQGASGPSYLRRAGTATGSLTINSAVSVTGVSVGSLLVLSGAKQVSTDPLVSVSDNAGNTWTMDIANAGSSRSANIASCIVATPPTTITATFTVATTANTILAVDEFSGITSGASRLDKTKGNWDTSDGSGLYTTGASVATTQNDELVVACFVTGTGTTLTPDAPYAGLTVLTQGSTQMLVEYKFVGVTGTQTATCHGAASTTFNSALATYKI